MLLPDGVGHPVGQDETALSVGVAHLNGLARHGSDNVAGDIAVGGDAVFHRGDDGGDIHRNVVGGQGQHRPPHSGSACHVPLDALHGGGSLQAVAAGVAGDPLAHQTDGVLIAAALIAQDDEAGGMEGAAPHGEKGLHAQCAGQVLVQHLALDAQGFSLTGHLLRHQGGGELVGRAVHQIPGQADGAGKVGRLLKGLVQPVTVTIQPEGNGFLRGAGGKGGGLVEGQLGSLGQSGPGGGAQNGQQGSGIQNAGLAPQLLHGLDGLGGGTAEPLRGELVRAANMDSPGTRPVAGGEGHGLLRIGYKGQPPLGLLSLITLDHGSTSL